MEINYESVCVKTPHEAKTAERRREMCQHFMGVKHAHPEVSNARAAKIVADLMNVSYTTILNAVKTAGVC